MSCKHHFHYEGAGTEACCKCEMVTADDFVALWNFLRYEPPALDEVVQFWRDNHGSH